MSSGSDSKIEVTQYYMSSWWAICAGPIDKLLGIKINDKWVFEGSRSANAQIIINRTILFGGVKGEGGVKGVIGFYRGTLTQDLFTLNSDALARSGIAGPYPSHRRIASLFFTGIGTLGQQRGFYWRANYPSIPTIEVKAQRAPGGLNPDYAMIGDDANPIHIAYEVMTDTSLGIGAPESSFDTANWEAAAQQVFDEGIGVSLLWVDQMNGEEFVNKVLAYVNAMRFTNPMTGLEDIRLIRGDYSTSGLFQINRDNANVSQFQRKMWGDTINEVIVTWTNPKNEKSESVSIQDPANIAMQGGIVSQTVDYPGVRSSRLAKRLAARDLRVLSNPLAMCKAVINREAWGIVPGDVVKVTWPEHGMSDVLMRVTDVDYGATGDSSIKVNLIEDVFGLDASAYYDPPDSGWLTEDIEARPLEHSAVITLPYYMLVRRVPSYSTLVDPQVRAAVLGADSSMNISQFRIAYETADAAGNTLWSGEETRSLLSYSTLSASITYDASEVFINIPTDGHGIEVNTMMMIGEDETTQEMCLVTAVGSTSVTVKRGMLDTTPKAWPSGTPIWFLNNEADIVDDVIRVGGQPITYRLRTMTSLGTLSIADAPDLDATLSRRPWLPLRPANCKVNTIANGTVSAPGASSLSLTWANRNRLYEDSVLLGWAAGSVTPESGQTTTITVTDVSGSTILLTVNGLTGTSYTLSTSAFSSAGTVVIKFTSKNAAGDESLQGHKITVNL